MVYFGLPGPSKVVYFGLPGPSKSGFFDPMSDPQKVVFDPMSDPQKVVFYGYWTLKSGVFTGIGPSKVVILPYGYPEKWWFCPMDTLKSGVFGRLLVQKTVYLAVFWSKRQCILVTLGGYRSQCRATATWPQRGHVASVGHHRAPELEMPSKGLGFSPARRRQIQ